MFQHHTIALAAVADTVNSVCMYSLQNQYTMPTWLLHWLSASLKVHKPGGTQTQTAGVQSSFAAALLPLAVLHQRCLAQTLLERLCALPGWYTSPC